MLLIRMSAFWMRHCSGPRMPENQGANRVITLSPATTLSPVEVAFLQSLLPGPRRTSDCQDAITVGSLLRLNLVAWHEIKDQRRYRDIRSTFALTPAAMQYLSARGTQECL